MAIQQEETVYGEAFDPQRVHYLAEILEMQIPVGDEYSNWRDLLAPEEENEFLELDCA